MRIAPPWADAPVDFHKFDRNSVEIPRYASIEDRFAGEAREVVSSYMAGHISRRDATNIFREALQNAETEAFVSGRRARGEALPEVTDSEADMLAGRHSRNMGYFKGFLDDIDDGKYKTGRNGPMTPMKRADLYAKSLWSLYTRGETTDWDEPENQDQRYYWILDPDAEHCKDCLERARVSRDNDGFTWEELVKIGFPGEGTVCMVHCRCHIRPVKARRAPTVEGTRPASTPEEGLETIIDHLGGPTMKVRMPAAGLPSVGLSPEVLVKLLAGDEGEMAGIARALPVVPEVLTKPESVQEVDPDTRVYYGRGLTLQIQRNDRGLWMLVNLLLGVPDDFGATFSPFGPMLSERRIR